MNAIIRTECPACAQHIEAPVELAQRGLVCPACNTGFIPAAKSPGKKVYAKCPHCGQKGQVSTDDLTHQHECFNCRQMVTLIPETSARRKVRLALQLSAVLFLFLIAGCIYHARVQALTDAMVTTRLSNVELLPTKRVPVN